MGHQGSGSGQRVGLACFEVCGRYTRIGRCPGIQALEAYSDASHANGGRSVQGTVLLWRGCIILWESIRQAFTTLSSAEAELVAMVYTVQACESVCPLIEEFLESDLKVSLLADNSAAISAFHPSMGSWRNRHLRMRALAGREKIESGFFTVNYVPGSCKWRTLEQKRCHLASFWDCWS